MKRAWILLPAVLCFMSAKAHAMTLEPEPGWATGDQIDKVIVLAKKSDAILCICWDYHESYWRTTAKRYMRNGALNGMARVLVYVSQQPPDAVRKIRSQVDEPDFGAPVLYFATPDDLTILGYVQSDSADPKVTAIANSVRKVYAWRAKAKKEVDRADKLLEGGKFKAAEKIYLKVIDEDKDVTIQVYKSWDAIVSKDKVEGLYFRDAVKKVDEMGLMADKRVQEAADLFDKKEYAKAKELLDPMVKDKSDLDAVKKAVELLAKVEEALKAK